MATLVYNFWFGDADLDKVRVGAPFIIDLTKISDDDQRQVFGTSGHALKDLSMIRNFLFSREVECWVEEIVVEGEEPRHCERIFFEGGFVKEVIDAEVSYVDMFPDELTRREVNVA